MKVADQLGIRVPQVFRILRGDRKSFTIVERIEGITLEETWPNLSCFATALLAIQLRRFVSLLRSKTSPTAGSLATGKCHSFWLEDRFGLPARSNPATVWSFIEFWAGFVSLPHAMRIAAAGVKALVTRWIPSMPTEFVLTHHDLAPRNMIVDRVCQLWLLDWEFAGWYPKFF